MAAGDNTDDDDDVVFDDVGVDNGINAVHICINAIED